ncbi:hypothetical protein F4805DRAFT_298765 [Annulohypoxylon moriforme]|nr:hypothetical protein F4805DRAFT_298765 [Annulohypoxylon moriforme]
MWIVQPELLDTYYKDSVWMFCVVQICNAHTIQFIILLLIPSNTWDFQMGSERITNTVDSVQVLIIWFIFVQAANIQLAVLALSAIEMKWNKRRAFRFMMIAFTVCSIGASSGVGYYAWTAGMVGGLVNRAAYIWQFLYVGITVGLFIVSLTIRQGSIIIRAWGEKSRGLPSGETDRNSRSSTYILDAIV